jgi:hypothetical protein
VPGQQPGLLEHREVMGNQVARETDEVSDLRRCPVGEEQLVDDLKPHLVAEGVVDPSSLGYIHWS